MRNFKKTLAILLSAAMVQGMLPSAAAAAENGAAAVLAEADDISAGVPDDGSGVLFSDDGSALTISDAGNIPEEILEDGGNPQPAELIEEAEDAGQLLPEGSGADFSGGPAADTPGNNTGDETGAAEGEAPEDIVIEEIALEEDPLLETEADSAAKEFLAGPLSGTISSRTFAGPSAEVSDNRNSQDYSRSRWSWPMESYLAADGTDYLRVENFDDGVLAERYDSGLLLKSQTLIPRELDIFGGFYAGSDAFYLVFGQTNPNENDSAEVVRIVKYDKNWNRLGEASLRGANTTVPFDAGCLRMAEYGGYLYIRTSHEMYTSSDGLNHQSNLMIQVRTSDMTITDCFSAVMNSSIGYVSHSFNQFILVDDAGNLVALDHGDAYPRGILLGMYGQKAGSSTFQSWYRNVGLLGFQGETGANYTGASIGGLEYSSTSYLTVGNSVPQDENWNKHDVWNVFATVTSRSNFSEGGSRGIWITDYAQNGNVTASTPQLVKLSSDLFVVMWNERNLDSRKLEGLCYQFLDGNGNLVGGIHKADGCLSDCQPIVSGQSALWYVTDGEKLMFYRVNADGTFEAEPGHLHAYDPDMAFEDEVLECGLIQKTATNKLTTNSDGAVTYTSSDTNVAEVDSSGNVTLKNLGTCTITAHAAAGINYRAESLSYTLTVLDLLEQVIEAPDSITCAFGDADFSLNVTCLDNAELVCSTGSAQVAEVSQNGIVSVRGVGTTEITVRARRTEKYAGAVKKISLTVEKKDIGDCQMAFTRIGKIPADEYEEYVIIADGERILEEDVDYGTRGGSAVSSSLGLQRVSRRVKGLGNYTGDASLSASPISQKPELTSLTAGQQGAVLEWEEETGALGYEIYRKAGSGEYQMVQKIIGHAVTSWTDPEALTMGNELSYYIKAYTKNNAGYLYTDASNKKSLGQMMEGCSISLSKDSFTYDGTEKTPSVTVSCDGEKLKQGRDYTVSYEDNRNAGKAVVVVTGKGDYSGSARKTFTISKAEQSLSVFIGSSTVVKGRTAAIIVSGSAGKLTYTSKNKKIATVSKKGVVKGKKAGKTVITIKAAGSRNYKAAAKKITIKVKNR